jgi:hypothetical protein
MLPKGSNDSSQFKTFEEARAAIESLVPEQSTMAELTAKGIDPAKHPNSALLTYAEVVRRFVPGSILTRDDLDPGVNACLRAREACRGVELIASRIARDREGNFFADFFNFSRRTVTTGWRFNAMVLLVNDVVVYRTWGGQANVNELEVRTNPLGPLQDIGPSTIPSPGTIPIK